VQVSKCLLKSLYWAVTLPQGNFSFTLSDPLVLAPDQKIKLGKLVETHTTSEDKSLAGTARELHRLC